MNRFFFFSILAPVNSWPPMDKIPDTSQSFLPFFFTSSFHSIF